MRGLKIFLSIIILLSFSTVGVFSEGLSDFYRDYSEFADSSIFRDPNTGRTIFPTLLVPLGGKYGGMGTAFTAVADDSGYIESNPAGSAVLEQTELSLHHNNWIADSSLEGVVYTLRINDLGIGFGGKFLYLPFTGYNEWGERNSRGYISETVATTNIAYNFFSGYYFYGLSIGANVKFAYRNIPDQIYPEQSILTAMTDFGLLTRFNFLKPYASRERNLSFGLAVKNIGLPDEGEPLPSVTTAGIAYSPIRPITLAFDYNYPFAFSISPDEWERPYLAGGIDVQFTDFYSVHSGFSHRGGNPRFSLGSALDLEKMRINLNYTLDMTTQVGSADRFSVEANLKLGDRGRGARRQKVNDYYVAGLEAYARGNLQRAIKYWKAALDIDPTFEPATENIAIAKRALKLQEDMRELKKVE